MASFLYLNMKTIIQQLYECSEAEKNVSTWWTSVSFSKIIIIIIIIIIKSHLFKPPAFQNSTDELHKVNLTHYTENVSAGLLKILWHNNKYFLVFHQCQLCFTACFQTWSHSNTNLNPTTVFFCHKHKMKCEQTCHECLHYTVCPLGSTEELNLHWM